MHLTFMSLVFFRRLPWALDYGLSLGCHGIFEREFECIGLHKVLPHSRCLVSSPTAQSLQPELTLVTSTIMHSCNMHRLRLIQIEPWLPEKIHHSLSLSCHSNPKSNQLSRGITKICVHVVCCKGNLSRINLSKTFSFIYGVPSTTADIIEDPHSQVLFIWLSCIQILAKGMAYFYRHLRRSLVLHGHGYGCCTGVYWHAWTDLRIRLWKLCCIISRSYPCRIEGWKIYLDWSNIVCSFPSYVTKGIKWSMHWPLRLLFQLRGCS